ncbi:MAG: hypothetical protein IPO92_08660 [Saprospiraceae bacterium]|nr:hypothetical protein [Saprospiraceae bacterium]
MADATEYDRRSHSSNKYKTQSYQQAPEKNMMSFLWMIFCLWKKYPTKLNGYADLTDEIQTIQTTCIKQESELRKLAKELTEKRSKVIAHLSKTYMIFCKSCHGTCPYIKVNITPLKELGKSRDLMMSASFLHPIKAVISSA